MTIEADAPVRYTLDGTEPAATSPRYGGPITLRETTHLRARAEALETTPAIALYPKLDWQAAGAPDGNRVPGLLAVTTEGEDWDEGPPPEALEPVARGVALDVDSVLARPEPTAVVLDGWLDVPADGIYTFWLSDHPRSRLLLDGAAVSPGMPSGERPARLALRRGPHRIGVRSLHEHPARDASLTWSGPGFARRPLDPDLLFHTTASP